MAPVDALHGVSEGQVLVSLVVGAVVDHVHGHVDLRIGAVERLCLFFKDTLLLCLRHDATGAERGQPGDRRGDEDDDDQDVPSLSALAVTRMAHRC